MTKRYEIQDTEDMITPQLVYYKETVVENIQKAIARAGGAGRLWPHVKSHKTAGLVKLQMDMGITRFKCATIAEAEMLADCGVQEILLAYPLVGPNIRRFIALELKYPDLHFWAIGDDFKMLGQLAKESKQAGIKTRVLLDVNMGMNRTGVDLGQAQALYEQCNSLDGIWMMGFHCYDGNHNHPDIAQRKQSVAETDELLRQIKRNLKSKGMECPVSVMGGTPSFPCHCEYEDVYLSPGTAFLQDAGYYQNLKDLDFVPAAVVLTRVISHPSDEMFTLDLGYKAIAADPVIQRGYIVNGEGYEAMFQNEEHWVFKVKEGSGAKNPEIGSVFYVIPTHICPTSALYPEILIVEQGKVTERWEVVARNRKLTV